MAKHRLNARQMFAQNLRMWRAKKGLTQEKLAELAGMHFTYIGSVERGERNIAVDNMERLARALGRELYQMLRELPDE